MCLARTLAGANRRSRDERGQSLVEFAVVLPILLLLLVGVINVGFWFWSDIGLTSATREAGRLLISSSNDSNAVQDVENRLAANLGSDIDPTKLQYSFTPAPATGTPLWPSGTTVTMKVVYPYPLSMLGISMASNMTTAAQVRVQ